MQELEQIIGRQVLTVAALEKANAALQAELKALKPQPDNVTSIKDAG